ncbi:MAG: prepilin-type N-terminal cleavage/methylation domain-containing protein [Sulfurospirillaceae bacterium]|nr:prepilin-type N-terminal cleavage/methylation domain-containing protein [Sulfurospirillaceae bacterium]
MKKSAFTMVELIFVIVIIGIVATVAIPKFSGLRDNAKKTAEIATVSAVTTALESAHGEWSINESTFVWGNNQSSALLNVAGYPTVLSKNGEVFGAVLKSAGNEFIEQAHNLNNADYNISIFTGPASHPTNGVKADVEIAGKPDKNDYWIYAHYVNKDKVCTKDTKNLVSGDFVLIDIAGNGTTNYNTITLTCN